MKIPNLTNERGSTLMVTIAVVATILVLLGSAVEYTSHVSRVSDRSRKTAQAMEIADGHLEMLFTHWRNIYRSTWTSTSSTSGGTDYSVLGTNFFNTVMYSPSPAPTPIPYMTPAATPPPIPTPPPSLFPSATSYQLTQYRIQAVDPMINVDANENAEVETSYGSETYTPMSPAATPPAAYGPNTWQYSFFYLAAADVTVPTMTGTVTAKVRRVFEKKFDNPWTYAMFFNDDLEFQPTTALTITGPIQTNGSLYIGTSNFTAQDKVSYAGAFVTGYAPNDTVHVGAVTAPNFAANLPPSQGAPYLPFGWNLSLNAADGSANNDSYHEIIERPVGGTDPIANVRYYNQANYRILIDNNNNVTITDSAGTAIVNSGTTKNAYTAITGAITTNQAIQDQREGAYVRLATVDVSKLTTAINGGTLTGNVLYFSDTSAGTSVQTNLAGNTVNASKRGIRLKNGATLPTNGLTVVAENPVYIQGDYNTGGTPPSDSGTYTSPTASGYSRKNAAVIGDAINVLSTAWKDSASTSAIGSRTATNTTVNAALVGGITPTTSGTYSGGGENFIRFLEDWKANSFCYYGSMVELWQSQQGVGVWTGAGNTYKAPLTTKYYYDTNFQTSAPPGKLQIAAYLQQQRWYQVY